MVLQKSCQQMYFWTSVPTCSKTFLKMFKEIEISLKNLLFSLCFSSQAKLLKVFFGDDRQKSAKNFQRQRFDTSFLF